MKKSLTGILALLAGAHAVHAQGTVSMGNYSSLPYAQYIYVSYKPLTGTPQLLGGSASGPTPTLSNYASLTGNGNDWSVQLYGALGSGLSASSLSPLAVIATFANGGVDSTPGTWFNAGSPDQIGPTGTYAGAVATVQLYAWYNEGGLITSYSQAVADQVPTGFSSTGNVTLGGPNAVGPASTAASLPALGNFYVSTVPEPSTIALGVVGASTFLMRLRRKK